MRFCSGGGFYLEREEVSYLVCNIYWCGWREWVEDVGGMVGEWE